jgi:predicted CXXCH cytochrome family protein
MSFRKEIFQINYKTELMKRYIILLILFIPAISFSIWIRNGASKPVHKESQDPIYRENEKDCKYCHSNIIKHNNLHAPVGDDCTTCHQSTGNPHPKSSIKGFTLAEKEPELCFICHEQNTNKSRLHEPVEKDKCTSCHSPHGSEYKNLLSKPTTSALCKSCHKLNISDKSHIHAPIETGGCESCHEPHQSDFEFLLIKDKNELCSTCHTGIETEKKAKYIHPPFDDNCSNCHNPHASTGNLLLNSETPGLCYECHSDVETGLKGSKSIHQPVEDERNCLNCHSAHSSSNVNLLSSEGIQFCFGCHDKEINTKDHVIQNMKVKYEVSKYKHSAIESGGCTGCHQPHSSNHQALLVNSYPEGNFVNGTPETYELCFNCHDASMITEQNTDNATGFRNGTGNLHYLHVQGEKGRNCSICHDIHASANKFLIKSRTTLGTWEMPMHFLFKETGGSCRTGCHIELSYDRINSINYDQLNITDHGLNTNLTVIDTNQVPDNSDTGDSLVTLINTNINIIENVLNNPVIKDSNQTTSIVIQRDTSNQIITDITRIDTVQIDSLIAVIPDSSLVQTDLIDTVTIDSVGIDHTTDVNPVLEKDSEKEIVEKFKGFEKLNILFEYNSTKPTLDPNSDLGKIIAFLNVYPVTVIEVIGYTDNSGSEVYNLELSRKRAEAIKKMLCDQGILPERIQIKAYGESKPVYSNETYEGRAKNRRVEFKLVINNNQNK